MLIALLVIPVPERAPVAVLDADEVGLDLCVPTAVAGEFLDGVSIRLVQGATSVTASMSSGVDDASRACPGADQVAVGRLSRVPGLVPGPALVERSTTPLIDRLLEG